MSVNIVSTFYRVVISLGRAWLQQTLPQSLFAQALEDDPNASEIVIHRPEVTPNVFALLQGLSEGKEPLKHCPDLERAHRYLNLPTLLAYADPFYDILPKEPPTKPLIDKIICSDRVHIYQYLMNKGYRPTDTDFDTATSEGAVYITALLLSQPHINIRWGDQQPLRQAARRGQNEIVRLLINSPIYQFNTDDAQVVYLSGNMESVKEVLAVPTFTPTFETIVEVIHSNHVWVMELLITMPEVQALSLPVHLIHTVIADGHLEMGRVLLKHHGLTQALPPDELVDYRELTLPGHCSIM